MNPAELAGESDLRSAGDEIASCQAVDQLGTGLFQVTMHAPGVAGRATPGQFAQIQVDPEPTPLLRRPFSFSRTDPQTGTVSFYLRTFGVGTQRLVAAAPGATLRMLGPLGRGFTIPRAPGFAVLVAGGLGVAPFPMLADWLVRRGWRVVWLNGAATAGQLYPMELLPPGLADAVHVTEDGTAGARGLVTDVLEPLLEVGCRVYACGPNPMLAAVAQATVGRAELEVSIEAPMGCGFGTCLGCAIPLVDSESGARSLGLCCRQGPVLPAAVVDWQRLAIQPAHLG